MGEWFDLIGSYFIGIGIMIGLAIAAILIGGFFLVSWLFHHLNWVS